MHSSRLFCEVDRRGLLGGVAEQTPVTLDIVVDEADDLEDIEAESSRHRDKRTMWRIQANHSQMACG